ncbi:hypothetical protein CXB51_028781 [Gossypium anomalum]|uniref:MULE transposase domain-containing protein n=1 Tax=Gossypium anomalum TaxID=47600 RepID=A0A8J5Y0K2_9ROSI|nr:hypothetical protein CXB51_028781 [Gossypium anomalum]
MSNFYGSNLNEGNEISMATSPFFTDQVFESREELMQWVQNTTFSFSYIIVTRRSKAKENGVVSYVTLICDRGVNNISNELENLFFIHPRSLDIWRAFSYILIVDATYKTNKYDLPFVQIVAVTSTNKTFSIAFAFIINEKEENYNWALTCLKLTLEECMYPRLALMNACQQVFPDATRLLCRWHITENIKKHCRQSMKLQHEWDSFCAMRTVLVESPMWILYTENYRKLQSMLSEYLGVLKYLDQVWLSKYMEMFVSVWIDWHVNFGERTTNRVESQHAKLKKYLCAKNSSLDKFVGCIDQIVKSQLTSIYESFEKSRIVLKHRHNLPCFRLLRGFVALEALDILKKELQHQLDSSNCGCKLRHSCGLPCACMLSVYLNSGGECILLDSIDVFWRKLDLLPSTSVKNEDICCDSELEMFKENFTKQPKAGKKILLRNRVKHSLKNLQFKKNTRGRPTLKKQQQKRVDSISQAPRRRSYSTTSKSVGLDLVELNKEPARHSSYVTEIPDLNQESSEQVSDFIDLNQMPESCDTHPLMKEIPDMFHFYITHGFDVNLQIVWVVLHEGVKVEFNTVYC